MKILILGFSASGKSTLCKFLGEFYNIPTLFMDSIYWGPNWTENSIEYQQETLKKFMDENSSWVIDGEYNRNMYQDRIEAADKIIFVTLPRLTCLFNWFKRLRQYKDKQLYSLTDGLKESFNWEFVWWILKNGRNKKRKARYKKIQTEYKDKVVVIKTKRQLNAYYERVKHEER